MVVKTFRGMLADGGQERIRLSTIKGKVGYRVTKFEVITNDPGAAAAENLIKIYTDEQTAVTSTIDFTDSALVGIAYMAINSDNVGIMTKEIIFDGMVFNQDIYVTCHDNKGSNPCNYYIELEVIPLDDAGAEYTTLKDFRQSTIS